MASILLYGGLLRNTSTKFIPINILLKQSPDWIDGSIYINKKPLYHINSSIDNFIEVKPKNLFLTKARPFHYLSLNDKVIYDSKDVFDLYIKVNLNPHIKDTPYANFFRYYQ